MVVGEHEHVLEVADDTDTERTHDVGVDKPSDIRGLVDRWGGVAVSRRVGLHAVNAGGTLELGDLGGDVDAVGAETLEN